MPEKQDPVWYILEKIQKDIDTIDAKQDEHLVTSTKLVTQLDLVSNKVADMNKLLLLDNGKPSIISQLNTLSIQLRDNTSEVTATKQLVSTLHTDLREVQKHIGMKTPKEVQAARWKAIGAISAGVLALIPGIVSFIHDFM